MNLRLFNVAQTVSEAVQNTHVPDESRPGKFAILRHLLLRGPSEEGPATGKKSQSPSGHSDLSSPCTCIRVSYNTLSIREAVVYDDALWPPP